MIEVTLREKNDVIEQLSDIFGQERDELESLKNENQSLKKKLIEFQTSHKLSEKNQKECEISSISSDKM